MLHFKAAILTSLWPVPAIHCICAQKRHKECATSCLGGMLLKTSSSISIWDVAGAEIAHLEERTAVGLDYGLDYSKRRAKAEGQ